MTKKELMKAIKINDNNIVIDNIDLSKMNIQIKTDIGGDVVTKDIGGEVRTGDIAGNVNIYDVEGYVGIGNVGDYVDIEDVGSYVSIKDIGQNVRTKNVGGYIDTSTCYQSKNKKILLPQIKADGIRRPYTSKKTYKGITIYNLYNDKNLYSYNYSHIITNGVVSAHGMTLEEAKESFKKKIERLKENIAKKQPIIDEIHKTKTITWEQYIELAGPYPPRIEELLLETTQNIPLQQLIEILEKKDYYGKEIFLQIFKTGGE